MLLQPEVERSAVTFFERLYRGAAATTLPILRSCARAIGRPIDAAREGELPSATPPLVWFHGASAGEIGAAAQLSRILRSAGFDFTAGYTTTNRAGLEFAERHAGTRSVVSLAPWDSPRWVGRAFDRWQPSALFLIENEIWPCLVIEAHRREIPVVSASARIYPRDVRRYRWARPFLGSTFARLTAVLAQDEIERCHFVELGADEERCFVAGNLKHAALPSDEPAWARDALGLGGDEPLVVFGSLHDDEIEDVYEALAAQAGNVRAVVAPRHESGARVALDAAARRGWSAHRRSEGSSSSWRILVLDTMGELAGAYRVAAVAVVGGTFRPHGGHDVFEPVRAGAPVLFGPHLDHVREEARILLSATPEARVSTVRELAAALHRWLREPEIGHAAHRAQKVVLPDPAEIAATYVRLLAPILSRLSPRSPA